MPMLRQLIDNIALSVDRVMFGVFVMWCASKIKSFGGIEDIKMSEYLC